MATDQSPYSGQQIVDVLEETYELHDRDGDKIGSILEINPQFLIVEKDGGLFGEDRTYYVPRSYVEREEGERWYLSIDKDELADMDWGQAPTDSDWTATDDSYTATESTAVPAGTEARTESGGTRIRRYEEELQTQKTQQSAGEAVISKDVVEEVQTIDVPVTREELRVERRPVSGEATAEGATDAFQGDSIRVPLKEEQVVVQKVARPVEEVEIGKVATQDTERVEDTVRKERIDVDEQATTTRE